MSIIVIRLRHLKRLVSGLAQYFTTMVRAWGRLKSHLQYPTKNLTSHNVTLLKRPHKKPLKKSQRGRRKRPPRLTTRKKQRMGNNSNLESKEVTETRQLETLKCPRAMNCKLTEGWQQV